MPRNVKWLQYKVLITGFFSPSSLPEWSAKKLDVPCFGIIHDLPSLNHKDCCHWDCTKEFLQRLSISVIFNPSVAHVVSRNASICHGLCLPCCWHWWAHHNGSRKETSPTGHPHVISLIRLCIFDQKLNKKFHSVKCQAPLPCVAHQCPAGTQWSHVASFYTQSAEAIMGDGDLMALNSCGSRPTTVMIAEHFLRCGANCANYSLCFSSFILSCVHHSSYWLFRCHLRHPSPFFRVTRVWSSHSPYSRIFQSESATA